MNTVSWKTALLVCAVAVTVGVPARAADIDRSAVDWKTPAEITWVRNAAVVLTHTTV